MNEGATPCNDSEKIGNSIGLKNLIFKNEIKNPTNSFKDRVGALLVSHARSWLYDKIICASNGNQGASLAAYCSLEGMKCVNLVPSKIDMGKKAQMIAYNSEILIKGEFVNETIKYALDKKYEDYYQATPIYNPLTIEAQKTIAFEIWKQKGVPDWIIIPMGSGELLVSIWKGFLELKNSEIIETPPKLVGVQSSLSSPIVNGFFDKKKSEIVKTDIQKSHALGILDQKPMYKNLAIKFIKESKGTMIAIPEDLIVSSVDELVRSEGIFAEPSSALTLAAVHQLNDQNLFDEKDQIVCLITGSGLKAPYILEAISTQTTTSGKGSIIITKLKILSQISLSSIKGISGTKIRDLISSISLAAIYQHLYDLESKGLIYRKKEGKNVLYFISDTGKRILDALDILLTLI
ncbi:MAG: pyridoxal-phosphate dependent enzyme [Promethearchaeota archaeon]|nr:MAG: pyridoxal-phosphate dependent enzyme [Candidatus Lokiarchaeota archaeon]